MLAAANFGACVWKAESNGQFLLNLARSWDWIALTDIRQWEYIPCNWAGQAQMQDVKDYGFLALSATGEAVPLVVQALSGKRSLIENIRSRFCDFMGIPGITKLPKSQA